MTTASSPSAPLHVQVDEAIAAYREGDLSAEPQAAIDAYEHTRDHTTDDEEAHFEVWLPYFDDWFDQLTTEDDT